MSPAMLHQDFNLPVHLAAASGHTHVVAYFIDTGIATVTDWAMHWSLLHIAAFAVRSQLLRLPAAVNCVPQAVQVVGTV